MKKILIVEDDEAVSDFLTTCLRSKGYEVEQAPDGRKGLERARQAKPDLIVLDLMMPGMHGFEFCRAVRSEEGLKDVPIVVSTAKTYETDRKAALRLGANKYLAKPYSMDALLEAIGELLGGAA